VAGGLQGFWIVCRVPVDQTTLSSDREIVISAPDATGLGVDITRVFLDFGVTVKDCDLMVDGGWVLLVFRVSLDRDTPARWGLLKQKLYSVCPRDIDKLHVLSHIPKVDSVPFIVTISGTDFHGMLHQIAYALWEADCSLCKAHVSTEGNVVTDTFWIYDNKGYLPQSSRRTDICNRLVGLLGSDILCEISPAPHAAHVVPKNISAVLESGYEEGCAPRRLACKDAASHSSLKSLAEDGRHATRQWSSSDSLSSHEMSEDSQQSKIASLLSFRSQLSVVAKEFDKTELVSIDVDSETSNEFILLQIRCKDRKGLLYDIFVQLKEIRVRVANCRTKVDRMGHATIDLMIQDEYGGELVSCQSTPALVARLKEAVAKPVQVLLTNEDTNGLYKLLVVAMVDCGGRGRPRVVYDVSRVLTEVRMSIMDCEVFVEEGLSDEDESYEVHTFFIRPCVQSLSLSQDDKRHLAEAIVQCLEGKFNHRPPLFIRTNMNEANIGDHVSDRHLGYPKEVHQVNA